MVLATLAFALSFPIACTMPMPLTLSVLMALALGMIGALYRMRILRLDWRFPFDVNLVRRSAGVGVPRGCGCSLPPYFLPMRIPSI